MLPFTEHSLGGTWLAVVLGHTQLGVGSVSEAVLAGFTGKQAAGGSVRLERGLGTLGSFKLVVK